MALIFGRLTGGFAQLIGAYRTLSPVVQSSLSSHGQSRGQGGSGEEISGAIVLDAAD